MLGGCSGAASSPAASEAASSATGCAAGAAAGTQIPEVVEGKFNVAMVLIGPHDDGGWSQAHYEGLQYLCENVDNTHVAYIENVPEGADSEQTFRSLARKGFDFIIGTSFGYMDPMETVAAEFPDQTFLHLTGYKSNGKNFGNFFGAMEDFKYLAGMLAGSRAKADGNPKIGYMATFPIPEELRLGNAIMRGVKVDLPRVHDGRRVHQHLARPDQGEGRRDRAVRRRRAGRVHGRRHRCRRGRRPGEGQVGRHLRPPGLLQGRRLPHRPVLDLGPGVHPHRRAGQGQDLHRRLRVLRRRLRRPWACSASWRARRCARAWPTCPEADLAKVKDTLATMLESDTGRFDIVFPGPIVDNTGKKLLAAGEKLEQSDLDQFPPGAPGSECTTCMYWWNEGITAELPKLGN